MGFWKKLFGLEKSKKVDLAAVQPVINVVEYKVNTIEDVEKVAKAATKKPAAKKTDAAKKAPAKKPAAKTSPAKKPAAKGTKKAK